MDQQPRSRICLKKRRRDRLIALSERNPGWVVGFEDEVWWSRLALPSLRAWGEDGEPLRLEQRSVPKDDPDPKPSPATGCVAARTRRADVGLRFVEGRPVSGTTARFLAWCLEELAKAGKKVLVLVWDNASWHTSGEVRRWMGEHNRQVKKGEKEGVRIISCLLLKKSPWLNPIEPRWMHGKRRVVETERLLSAQEVAERVCSAFDCPHHEHLPLPENVA